MQVIQNPVGEEHLLLSLVVARFVSPFLFLELLQSKHNHFEVVLKVLKRLLEILVVSLLRGEQLYLLQSLALEVNETLSTVEY